MDDAAFITQLQAGDQQAFRQLVERYERRVYNTVLTIVRDPDEADDVAQDVFIQVFESIGQLGRPLNLTGWVYRIATTKALLAYRRRRTRKRFAWLTRIGLGTSESLPVEPTEWIHPGVELERQERAGVLLAAIDRLPDRQKVAFVLHNVEGLSYQEVAQVMQRSLSAVESLLHRAKLNLQHQLRSYYNQDR